MRVSDLRLSLPLLLSAISLPAQIDPALGERIRSEGIAGSQVMQTLDELTNTIGQRLTGSDNFMLACEWAKEKFESYGLSNVHLDEWGEFPVRWNRGQWSGRVVEPKPIELQVATMAWTAGTKGRVGGVLRRMPKTMEELVALGGKLGSSYLWGNKPREEVGSALDEMIAKEGVLGFVMRNGERDRTYPTRMRVFGNHRVDPDNLPKIPQITVRQDQADEIEKLLEGEQPVIVEFDIRNRFRRGPVKLHNVIAEIPGTEQPDEVVVVCGHLDSWHQATGTTDNGTGVATTLEAARILMAVGAKPKRTIRFMLWGGEEQGLLGSRSYVTRHRTEMDKVSAVFNHDTGTNWAHSLTVTTAMEPHLKAALAEAMHLTPPDPEHEGPVLVLDARPTMSGGGGGSDHASFLSANVPAWSWGLKGRSDYFRYTWHSQWDTYDVAIPEYMRHTSTVVAIAALGTANLPVLLPREGIERGGGRRRVDIGELMNQTFGAELDGLMIKSVQDGGMAANAGLKAGDKIVAAAGSDVASLGELRAAMRGEEGAKVALGIQRGDSKLTVEVPAIVARGRRASPEQIFASMFGAELDGLSFKSVEPERLAAGSGIQAGDRIIAVNGEPVQNLGDALRALMAGDRSAAKLTLQRGDKQLTVQIRD